MIVRQYLTVILCVKCFAAFSGQWQTYYEQHNYNQTPSYSQTIEFSKQLAQASDYLHYTTFGTSHQNRDLPLLIFDWDRNFDPQAPLQNNKVVILIKACIHAGEPDGKDAGLTLLRDIVIHGKHNGKLDNVTILFIPIFNVDGHERFGPYNRINQNGPQQVGWRTNAINLNLNRDYLKTDTREMQYFAQLWSQWNPDFFIDTHSTNGADYQYTMTYIMETARSLDKDLASWSEQNFFPQWEKYMQEYGYDIFPYITFRQWHDPRSGIRLGTSPPALSNGYAAVRNRPGLLLETHMLKPYKKRVESTYLSLEHAILFLDKNYKQLKQLLAEADSRASSPGFRKEPFPLDFRTTSDSTMIEFKGVEYTVKKSSLTAGDWFIYHNDKPATFEIPVFNTVEVATETMLPDAYIIPAQWHEVIRRLGLHGVKMEFLQQETEFQVDSYRFFDVRLSSTVNEGRQTANFKLDPITQTRSFPAGSAIISMNQPAAQFIAHALEPLAPSSFAYWGEFNAIFQRVEYYENYVMEPLARKMLEEDPDLRKRFEHKMATDPEFASSQRSILNWFYEQTPYYDQQHNIYPVGKLND
jgi:murein tripeptide amidase MpaA